MEPALWFLLEFLTGATIVNAPRAAAVCTFLIVRLAGLSLSAGQT